METSVNLDHLLDGSRKGFLKPGIVLSGKEYLEAARRGLKSHKGQSLELVQPTPDPLSTKVLRLQAPLELRDALTQAETRFNQARTLCEQAQEHWEVALNERAEFSRQVSGSALTDTGVQRALLLDGNIERAEKSYREAEGCQQQARIDCLQATQGLENWARSERSRREEQTRLAAEAAKKPKTIPLSERLSKLKRKISSK